MAYYTNPTCDYKQGYNSIFSGCTIDYVQSEVKYMVDAWKTAKAPAASESRLIQYDELIDNLGYSYGVDIAEIVVCPVIVLPKSALQ